MHPNVHSRSIYDSPDMEKPKYSSADEWLKMWYIYIYIPSGILLSHKKNETMPFAANEVK